MGGRISHAQNKTGTSPREGTKDGPSAQVRSASTQLDVFKRTWSFEFKNINLCSKVFTSCTRKEQNINSNTSVQKYTTTLRIFNRQTDRTRIL